MSTRREHPCEECLFGAMSFLERIASKNQCIFYRQCRHGQALVAVNFNFYDNDLEVTYAVIISCGRNLLVNIYEKGSCD